MTIKEIVKEYLEQHGFDGLFSYHCACELADLMPCEGLGLEEPIALCEPATKSPAIVRKVAIFTSSRKSPKTIAKPLAQPRDFSATRNPKR